MLDPELESKIHKNNKRTDVIVIVFMTIASFLFIIFFSLVLAKMDQNQKRTQDYIKCVANTLTTPIAARSNRTIDNCTDNVDANTKEAN